MNNPSNIKDAAVNQRADKMLFIWLLLTGWFGVLMGVPWTIAVLRGYPGMEWWWEGAIDFLFFIPASDKRKSRTSMENPGGGSF